MVTPFAPSTGGGSGLGGLFIGVIFFLIGLFLFIITGSILLLIGSLVLGVIVFIFLKKPTWRYYFIIVIIIILLAYLVFFLFFTPTGSLIRGEAGVGGVQATEGLRGITGPLNLMSQILRGDYNPRNLWDSQEVQSQYVEVKDVGVVLVSAGPLRDEFDIRQDLVVAGRINAIAFPGREVTATIGIRTKTTLPGPVGNIIEVYLSQGWSCSISQAGPSLPVREVRNRPFTCILPADSEFHPQKEIVPYITEISATAGNTQTVGGKQFVFSSPEVLLSLERPPLEEFQISPAVLESWQTGDESMTLAINVAGQPDVLETGAEQFLGVRVLNPASHTGTAKLSQVQMLVPTPPLTTIGGEDFSCRPLVSREEISSALTDFGINTVPQGQGFTLCTSQRAEVLTPADPSVLLFTKVTIPEGALQNQEFGTFFVLAKVNYDYTNMKLVPLRVIDVTA
ncbi:MAG TPA: hypothetical protein VJ110_03890 [Candidatus Nanoarchaeia archaeon]|nr:hypothetical protein [Candidatus Nanoarchaeia archaeon]